MAEIEKDEEEKAPKDDSKAVAYANLLKPNLASGKQKAKDGATKAKGEVVAAWKWFKELNPIQQQDLKDMAVSGKEMTKEAISALTARGARLRGGLSRRLTETGMEARIHEQGLSKAAVTIAKGVFDKAQDAFTDTMASASKMTDAVKAKASLSSQQVLASNTVQAFQTWVASVKEAAAADEKLVAAKDKGDDLLKQAQEAAKAANAKAQAAGEDAKKLAALYMRYAQEQMTALSETETGKQLSTRTEALLSKAKEKGTEAKDLSAQAISVARATKMAQAAEKWAETVTAAIKDKSVQEDAIIQKQTELAVMLENQQAITKDEKKDAEE